MAEEHDGRRPRGRWVDANASERVSCDEVIFA